jgi:hypothetical protein
MSTNTTYHWLNWQPKSVGNDELTKPGKGGPYLLEKPRNPTDKTDKTSSVDSFVSFVSPLPRQFQKIRTLPGGSTDALQDEPTKPTKPTAEPGTEPEPSVEELSYASAFLGQAGVRLMWLEGGDAVGVWSDLDSPAIRTALRALGSAELPVLYLDGPNVPLRYKLRRVPGEPVPQHIREEMERSVEPWKVRSRTNRRCIPWPLAETKPCTGVRAISKWGAACGRGFVSDLRFGANQPVIRRTSRNVTRKWRALNGR